MQVAEISVSPCRYAVTDFSRGAWICNSLRSGNVTKTCCSLTLIAPLKPDSSCLQVKTFAVMSLTAYFFVFCFCFFSFQCVQYLNFELNNLVHSWLIQLSLNVRLEPDSWNTKCSLWLQQITDEILCRAGWYCCIFSQNPPKIYRHT